VPPAPQFIRSAFNLRLIGCDDQIEIVPRAFFGQLKADASRSTITTASLRWVSSMGRLLHARFENDLDAAV
jgi:hypothetical protein